MVLSKSIEPNKMLHSAASHLGLHYSLMSLLWGTMNIWVTEVFILKLKSDGQKNNGLH